MLNACVFVALELRGDLTEGKQAGGQHWPSNGGPHIDDVTLRYSSPTGSDWTSRAILPSWASLAFRGNLLTLTNDALPFRDGVVSLGFRSRRKIMQTACDNVILFPYLISPLND